MTDYTNTPELRFPEFNHDWSMLTLGDIGKVEMNKRIYKSQTSDDEEIPFYKISTFGKEPTTFISREIFEEYKEKFPYPNKGDILISASGSIGKTIEYNGEEAYFQDSNIVWLNHNQQVSNKFLKQFYSIIDWKGIEGSTIKRLYNRHILNTIINLPLYEEQEKIGTFFSKLDRQIELEEKKLELLEQQKRGYMQKIFSQELRFKDDNGNKYPNWETKKLSSIATIIRGLTYKPSDIRQNGVRVLRSSNILNDKFHIYKDDVFVDKNIVKIPLASEDDILITAANGSPKLVGKHALIKDLKQDSVAGGFMYLLKSEYAKFIQIWMNSKEYKKIITKVQGGNGSIGNLSRKDLENGVITIPCLEEQKKIGIFFSEIDKCSETLEQKIKILKQRKKGLLQKMFV